MTDQWLRTFILSAECGSFSKAARALYISTPSLVQQINLFEKELGFAVFERSSTGLKLTPAGESFLETARMIQDIYQDGRKRAEQIAEKNRKEIVFGFAPYQFPEHWLTLLNEFHDEYSDKGIGIRLVSVPMKDQIAAVHTGKIDTCLLAKPKTDHLGDLKYKELLVDTYSFCMNGKHPLSKKSVLSEGDLVGYTIVCGHYPYMEQDFKDALGGGFDLRQLETEYDLGTRFDMAPEELFVIHSKWRDPFSLLHRVVDSDISAGSVGFIYSRRNEDAIEEICRFFSEHDA